MRQTLLLALLAASFCIRTHAIEPPNARNTLHIIPLWNAMAVPQTSEDTIRTEMDRLIEQCGKGDAYHRLGFGFIYPAGKPDVLRRDCRLAKEKGLVLGVIIGMQTHGNAEFQRKLLGDLRSFQWRSDGKTWTPLPKPEKPLDWHENLAPVCSSRYCDPVRSILEKDGRQQAREILAVMKDFPGVIAVINPLIEQGLGGGTTENGTLFFNDVGPYTTTEFRDWLRHTGRYDADTGTYAGQGAPETITGPWVKIKGMQRSPFYDDASPGDANKTGKPFNLHFGTRFASWKLRYYDLEENTAAISDPTFNLMPESGPAFVKGGFQLPAPDPLSAFWRAWTWVNQEQRGEYPPGNPSAPAFGFAQVMSRNYVNDFFAWLIAEGLPADRLYAHQVPCEALGDSPVGVMQARTMAMNVWTGYVPASETVGITRFGHIDPKLMTHYAKHWGIFEWHPQPNVAPDSQRLYESAKSDLEEYTAHGCRYLFPGWWHPKDKPNKDTHIFQLPDSRFTEAIRDFLAAQKNAPLE